MTYKKRFRTFGKAFRAAQKERRSGCKWVVSPTKPRVFQIFEGKNKVLEIYWGLNSDIKEK